MFLKGLFPVESYKENYQNGHDYALYHNVPVYYHAHERYLLCNEKEQNKLHFHDDDVELQHEPKTQSWQEAKMIWLRFSSLSHSGSDGKGKKIILYAIHLPEIYTFEPYYKPNAKHSKTHTIRR